jgi:hypothetical protein
MSSGLLCKHAPKVPCWYCTHAQIVDDCWTIFITPSPTGEYQQFSVNTHNTFAHLLACFAAVQVLGRQCGSAGWPGEQVIVTAAAKRYIRAAVKLAQRGQFSKKDGE